MYKVGNVGAVVVAGTAVGSNPEPPPMWTHLQVNGSKGLGCHADLYAVSRCHTRGESEDHYRQESTQGTPILTLKPRVDISFFNTGTFGWTTCGTKDDKSDSSEIHFRISLGKYLIPEDSNKEIGWVGDMFNSVFDVRVVTFFALNNLVSRSFQLDIRVFVKVNDIYLDCQSEWNANVYLSRNFTVN